MGGGGGGSGPTVQQRQLETQQALTSANLNVQENEQRKAILNSMEGTRVFRGSALSRSMRGNTPGSSEQPGPSPAQQGMNGTPVAKSGMQSLLDEQVSNASGATVSGGAGASATPRLGGAYAGGGNAARGAHP